MSFNIHFTKSILTVVQNYCELDHKTEQETEGSTK